MSHVTSIQLRSNRFADADALFRNVCGIYHRALRRNSEMIFAPLDLVQDMYFGLLGATLFSTSGGLVLSARVRGATYPRTGDHNAALLAGSLAVVNAFIMIFDLTLAYMDSEEFDDEASV
uniref:Uncharacterized protein n=1 Tax=Bombyx mori TaxID=7091 RepID=A0A8R2QZI3_BOMMO|nr:uncharacterized protein LOC101743423 isoform X3 [Bombyx mori]